MTGATISLATSFSRYPSGRFRTDGPHSGQKFREEFLVPALNRGGTVIVDLDNVVGLPASFLEEAFGGLVRQGFSKPELKSRLRITATQSRLLRYPSLIAAAIEQAHPDLARAS